MCATKHTAQATESPSTRKAWIEIIRLNRQPLEALQSPSTRKAWIEISPAWSRSAKKDVAFHTEGVD